MENIELVINRRKLLTSTDNSIPLAMLRLLYITHAGGNSDSIFISKLYYLYRVSFEAQNIESTEVLVSPPYDINRNLRKMIVILSNKRFIDLEEKNGKVKVLLTETGKAIIRQIDSDNLLKTCFSKISDIVRKITDSDLKKQQLMW